jgi:phosphoglycolate phosphatase-like HAD superfamily hydrolase
MTAVQAVIFDLDGTLVQTRVASWEVFAPISERFGLGISEPEQARRGRIARARCGSGRPPGASRGLVAVGAGRRGRGSAPPDPSYSQRPFEFLRSAPSEKGR